MVKVKTNNPHMSEEEIDTTKEKAEYLINTGNYIYVDEICINNDIIEDNEKL